jgi:hypothetical protein
MLLIQHISLLSNRFDRLKYLSKMTWDCQKMPDASVMGSLLKNSIEKPESQPSQPNPVTHAKLEWEMP